MYLMVTFNLTYTLKYIDKMNDNIHKIEAQEIRRTNIDKYREVAHRLSFQSKFFIYNIIKT